MIGFFSTRNMISGIAAVCMIAIFTGFPRSIAAEGEDVVFTEISDVTGLAGIADAPGGNYKLMSDIDLGKSAWLPIPFSGRLDGNGYTIYNLHVTGIGNDKRITRDGNLKEYDTEFAGLFSVMENAEVTNLNIKGAFVDIPERSDCFTAILAGYADNSKVTGCSLEGRVHMISGGKNAGVAGIIGYGTGIETDDCEADVELVFEDRYRDGKCEQFMGGILSCGIGKITHCNIHINGYDSCHGYVHNGGIVGMYYRCGSDYYYGSIEKNRVEGQISFFEDNRDRRAYCSPIIGEPLTKCRRFRQNTHSFKSNETRDFSKVLSPEMCESPDYEVVTTPPTCSEWGYTNHRCGGCGYSWTDSYTFPRHEAGGWITVSDSDYEHTGLERRYCTVCGAIIDERTINVSESEIPADDNQYSHVLPVAVLAILILVPAAAALIIIFRKKTSNSKTNSVRNKD